MLTKDADFLLLHDAWRRWSTAWGVTLARGGILKFPDDDSQTMLSKRSIFLSQNLPISNQCYEFRTHGQWTRIDVEG